MTPESPTGVIVGQTPFIVAAYVITWLTFAGYAVSLWVRARSAKAAEATHAPAKEAP